MSIILPYKLTATASVSKKELLEHIKDDALLVSLNAASVVLLPEQKRSADNKLLFQPDTKEVFDYLTEHSAGQLQVEIASTDEEFVEVALHGAEFWLPMIFVVLDNQNAISVTLNVLSNYIYDRMKGALTKPQDAKVHSKIVVDYSKGVLALDYEGPAGTYESVMKEAIGKLSQPDK